MCANSDREETVGDRNGFSASSRTCELVFLVKQKTHLNGLLTQVALSQSISISAIKGSFKLVKQIDKTYIH